MIKKYYKRWREYCEIKDKNIKQISNNKNNNNSKCRSNKNNN